MIEQQEQQQEGGGEKSTTSKTNCSPKSRTRKITSKQQESHQEQLGGGTGRQGTQMSTLSKVTLELTLKDIAQ
jgi:hypothetical protein